MDLREARRRQVGSQKGGTLAPVLTALSITSDRVAGGAAITLTGTNFLSGATVTIGGVAATSVVVVSLTSITAVVPAGTEGIVDVVVSNVSGGSSTLEQSFEYIAAHILSLTPARGLTSGGQNVLIRGVNFVTGSTITFGGTAATGVTFIDGQNYYATTPAHAAGSVTVVITEPLGTVVTELNAYIFSSAVFQDDIRKRPSITIKSQLNGVSMATFTIDGKGTKPVGGETVIFTDESELCFSGKVQSVEQITELIPRNWAWMVTAVDHSAYFNRLRPFGVYHNTSATQIVKDWVAKYAPGFTSAFVRTNLPRVSITADGEQDFRTLMNMLCEKIGSGYWRVDYNKAVHFFHNAVPFVGSAALSMPPGTALTAAASATSSLGYPLIPGYYYFAVQGEYGAAKTYRAPPFPNLPPSSEGYVLLSNEAAQRNLQGDVPNGRYVEADASQPTGSQPYWKPGWIGFTDAGVRGTIGNYPSPWVLGSYYLASPDVAATLEGLVPGWFKTALTPISNLVFLSGTLPTLSSIPTFTDIGAIPCHTRNVFAVRYGDAMVAPGAPLQGYAVIADNVTTTLTTGPSPTFAAPVQPSAVLPFAPPGKPSASESTALNSAASYMPRDAQAGYWSFIVTCVYQDGTESRGSSQSSPVLFDGLHQATLSDLPIGTSINAVPVMFRKVYACLFTPTSPLVLGTPDFTQGLSKLVAIVANNVDKTATFSLGGELTGGNRTPANVPPGIADTLGPDLEEADAPSPIVDGSPFLLEPPFTVTSDESQLRNRVYVKGKGSIVVADSAIGATSIRVADVTPFITPSGGGTVILGSRRLAYVALSTVVGAGSLTLALPLTAQVSQSDWLFGGGLPIRPFIQVDDLESQQTRGAIERDANGLPTDGVHEFTIADDKLTTYDQMVTEGKSCLRKYAWPIETIHYGTRDPSKVGTVVSVNLTQPPCVGDFLIQEVVIDQYHDVSSTLLPRYTVTAEPARMTLDEVMLKAYKLSTSVPTMAGVTTQAATTDAEQAITAASSFLYLISASPDDSMDRTLNSVWFLPQPAVAAAALDFDWQEGPYTFSQGPGGLLYFSTYELLPSYNDDQVYALNPSTGALTTVQMGLTGDEGYLTTLVYDSAVDRLYVAANRSTNGAFIGYWDGSAFTQIAVGAVVEPNNDDTFVCAMTVTPQGQLFTQRGNAVATGAAGILRWDGSAWMVDAEYSASSVFGTTVFNDAQLWSNASGEVFLLTQKTIGTSPGSKLLYKRTTAGVWSNITPSGLAAGQIWGIEEYNGELYVGYRSDSLSVISILKRATDGTWTTDFDLLADDPATNGVNQFIKFNDRLYALTGDSGYILVRTLTTWEHVATPKGYWIGVVTQLSD